MPVDDRQLLLAMEAALAMHQRDRGRRQTIAGLQQQTQTMETVLDSISDGVVVADEHGDLSIFSSRVQRIVGWGKADGSLFHWGDGYGLFHADSATTSATHRWWGGHHPPETARNEVIHRMVALQEPH